MQTSHALAKRGCEINLIMGRNEFDLAADALPYYSLEPNPNLHLHTVCMLRREGKQKIHVSWNGIFHIACLLKIRKMLREKQFHALYTRHPNIADFFLKHRRSLKMPIIFEAHEIFHLTTERKDKIQKMKAQEARIYSKVDGIVTTTKELKDQLKKTFHISSDIAVIPNGVNIEFFESSLEKVKIGRILYVGQLYPWKGVDTLLKAMCFVPKGELHIVGGDKQQIDDLILQADRLSISNRVFFHGHVSPHEVRDFLKSASVVVHPLAKKNTKDAEFSSPLKMFEYMAARIPIVASDLPGIREILTDQVSALLVPPDDPKVLAKGIQLMLDDPKLRQRLSDNAYETVQQHSWAKRAERIEQYILDIHHIKKGQHGKQVDKSHYQFNRYMHKRRWISSWYQLKELMSVQSQKILEVGPGSGVFKQIASMSGVDVKTFDIDEELHPDYIGSVLQMPFENEAFETVCAFQMLEHLPYEHSLKAFQEFKRISSKNIIISLPDARRVWTWIIQLPWGTIEVFIPKPQIRPEKHIFKGQHYWEINKRGFPLKKNY